MQNFENTNTGVEPGFEVQKIYLKEITCKVPQAPDFFVSNDFKENKWKPNFSIEIHVEHQIASDNCHEVTLDATISAKNKENNTTAFMLEAQQTGIFVFNGMDKNQIMKIIQSHCPTILYPYLNRSISDASIQAGFPSLIMPMPNLAQHDIQNKQSNKLKTNSFDTNEITSANTTIN